MVEAAGLGRQADAASMAQQLAELLGDDDRRRRVADAVTLLVDPARATATAVEMILAAA
jgi:hypothetical protein